MIYNKYTFGLHTHFWHRAPKTLYFLRDKSNGGAPYVNGVTFGKLLPQDGGWLPEEPNTIITEGGNFQRPLLPQLLGGKRARRLTQPSITSSQLFNQSRLCNEASTEPQQNGAGIARGLVDTGRFGGSSALAEGVDGPCIHPYSAQYVTSLWLVLS